MNEEVFTVAVLGHLLGRQTAFTALFCCDRAVCEGPSTNYPEVHFLAQMQRTHLMETGPSNIICVRADLHPALGMHMYPQQGVYAHMETNKDLDRHGPDRRCIICEAKVG